MKKIFVFALVACGCFACELTKDIDYRTYFDEKRIIVHGYLITDGGVELVAKRALAPNRIDDDARLSNPVVTLFADGERVATLVPADDGLRFATPAGFRPRAGVNYRVEVQADGFPTVSSAVQTLVATVGIDSLRLSVYEPNPNFAVATVYWTHRPASGYGYTVKTCGYRDGKPTKGHEDDSSDDILTLVGTDDYPAGVNACEILVTGPCDSVQVSFYTLSPDMLRFLKSQEEFRTSYTDPFFEQPYPVFSNIEGGYGVFGAYGVVRESL